MGAWHHFFFYIATLMLLLYPSMAEPIKGLSLKLIHRDSLHSPLSPPNLTQVERLRNLIDRSKLRAHHLASTAMGSPDTLHPSVRYEASSYVVELGVGTPPPTYRYYLIMDSASDLVWLQCDGCNECFPQQQPIFKPDDSPTYRRMPCDHPLCEPNMCDDHDCIFNQTYMNNMAWTSGILSSETFTFTNESGGDVTVLDGVIFGCGYNSNAFPFKKDPNDNIVGVFGLGPGPRSFLSQFGFQRRFSYCLANWDFGPPQNTSNLRFGDEALLKISGLVETTSFVPSKNTQMYYLNLKDITVGTKRLGIAKGTFELKPDGSGGVVIDSGTSISFLVKGAYEMVRNALVEYFKPSNLPIIDGSQYGLDLCFDRSSGFGEFPSLMFHFQGSEYEEQEATLVSGPFSTFFLEQQEKYFCLAMLPMPNDQLNILGAKQQTDNRFLYDGTNNTLSFIPEDCDDT